MSENNNNIDPKWDTDHGQEEIKKNESESFEIQLTISTTPTAKSKSKEKFPKAAVCIIAFSVLLIVVLLCGYFSNNFSPPHVHKYGEWETEKEASCTEDGKLIRYCECGKKERDTVPAEGHEFGEWYDFLSGTCISLGEEMRTCYKCFENETRYVPQNGKHIPTIDKGVPPTCSSTGLSEGMHCVLCNTVLKEQVSIPVSDHSLDNIVMEDEYCNDRQLSSVYCSHCGEYITSYGHHYVKSVISATCTQNGEERYTCDICGDSYFNVIPSGGHIGGDYEIITAATCKNEGVVLQQCMICDEILDVVTLDKKSHTYVVCSASGVTVNYECSKCKDGYSVESDLEVFTVSFESQNSHIGTSYVQYGGRIEDFPEVEREGYRLLHWVINDGSNSVYDNGCIYENTQLAAVWEKEAELNTKESDIAVFSGVGVDFAFTVVADSIEQVGADNLLIYNSNNETVSYFVEYAEAGTFTVRSGDYEPGEIYYAVAKNDLAFLGTDSKELSFSIAGDDYVNIEVGSQVKWLEYSDVYGVIDSDSGNVLLTNCLFNVGDSVAIYEDNKENIVLVIDILGVSSQMGYNAYLFDVADYEKVFDNFDVSFSGDLAGGEIALDPGAADAIKSEFMASSLYRNARSAAVLWGKERDIQIKTEDISVSLGMEDGRVIASITFTIKLEDDWEINIIYKNVISVGFDYRLSKSLSPTAIVKTTNHQTFEINLSNSRDNKVAKVNAKDAYESYKEIFEKIKENPDYDVKKDYDDPPREFRIGGVDIPILYGITASVTLYAEFDFEATGTVGVSFEITSTQLIGIRDGSAIFSTEREITGANMFISGKLRIETLVKLELFINVVGIGVYGDVGIGPYAEIGGAGSMGYDGHDIYMSKFSIYFDAGIRFEGNVGIKCKFLGKTIADKGIEIFGNDYPFRGFPIGSKEIWLSFEEYEEEINIHGSCDKENTVNLSDIINVAIKYQNIDDMTFSYKNPDKVYYSIDSLSGYRSKIRLRETSLALDSIGENVEIVLKIKVSDTIYKTVVVHYTVEHSDDCIHFLCSNGFHRGGKATCIERAICERCGLEYGDEPIGHTYENRECIRCGEHLASEGLGYAMLDDGTYEVTGVGSCRDTTIVIPDENDGIPVTSIREDAFMNVDTITKVVIGKYVTSIGSHAFYNCSSLISIVIPDSVTSIGSGAFSRTQYYNDKSNWNNKVLYIGNHLISASQSIEGKYVIKDGTKSIADSAFNTCLSLSEVIIPNGVVSVGVRAFSYCRSISEIIVPDSVISIGKEAFSDCSGLKNATLGNSIKSIGDRTFYNCNMLEEITIPDSVISIGEYAFSHLASLKTVVIGKNVTNIGNHAFAGCYLLTSVVIPDSVTIVGEYAFADCIMLEKVVLGNSVKIIGDWAFSDCDLIAEITIPDSVTSIGESAFRLCPALHTVVIGKNVTSIGSNAFCYCISLTNIVISDSVTSIGENAFYGTEYYDDETNWENGILYLGNYLIKSKEYISGSYVINDGTKVIADRAFGECYYLIDVKFPDSVTNIGKSVFSGSKNLKSVTLSSSIVEIPYCAFNGCSSLEKIVIPNNVDKIGIAAFEGCSSLKSVVMGNKIKSLEIQAFNSCNSLTTIYYSGTKAQWEGIFIAEWNDAIKRVSINYNYVPK